MVEKEALSQFLEFYVGMVDKEPRGATINKGLTLKTGQTQVQPFTRPLLKKMKAREIDPAFVITHSIDIEEVPAAYKTFRDHEVSDRL